MTSSLLVPLIHFQFSPFFPVSFSVFQYLICFVSYLLFFAFPSHFAYYFGTVFLHCTPDWMSNIFDWKKKPTEFSLIKYWISKWKKTQILRQNSKFGTKNEDEVAKTATDSSVCVDLYEWMFRLSLCVLSKFTKKRRK